MKCLNPDCNRRIGLVAHGRGWFSKRRYCSNIAAMRSWLHQSYNGLG